MNSLRCHWVYPEDGEVIFIPGCWARAIDPAAQCTCGKWCEETAKDTIVANKRTIYHLRHQIQQLRQALARAGVTDPTTPTDWRAVNAAQRKRRFHMAISEAGQ